MKKILLIVLTLFLSACANNPRSTERLIKELERQGYVVTKKSEQPIKDDSSSYTAAPIDTNKDSGSAIDYEIINIPKELTMLVFTNNSDENLYLEANVVFKNSIGIPVGAKDFECMVIGPKESCVAYRYLDSAYDKAEVSISTKSAYYYSGNKFLELVSNKTEYGAVHTITNNGEVPISYVNVYTVFYKDGVPVDMTTTYIQDIDYEIKPGKSISKDTTTYDEFDSFTTFISSSYKLN